MEEKTFLDWIIGNMPVAKFLAALVFALIGIAISTLIDVVTRRKDNGKSPTKFKFSFLVYDNKQKFITSIVLNILLVLVFIRFTNEFINVELSMFIALLIGASIDNLLVYFKKIRKKTINLDNNGSR